MKNIILETSRFILLEWDSGDLSELKSFCKMKK
ncbi:hypothetical protein SAG0076_01030 [Streptococcus agalactiae CCUG 47293]|uniref:Uncharacterized protein n=1 Tax=Streptococcus agalactiae CCUG 29376 TaxID=1105255 RepID=A0AAV3JH77_STRAG|nr:hypothetical protein SAG0067_00910 [Streptococcus agalactiae CCUG 39096 A]EPT77615.1 hypothetical protein SAG0070_09315 [Streptococcus agalactiae CCUG 44077]EPT83759.1 hypothetical protein SAG0094_07435 [Streptococcus agalactiae BSU450]EPT96484.1 hypothetical protein SAG0108_02280 [Streptococcus agalactiae BSU92]EPU09135.1 hypothetical protein SAG0127_00810 [Streptococcus agalactiae STIR-CD-23]EPU11787.1 hypothetical protein SAG0126_05765 [Streptococcus agalactiae STIR-CD-22]EPU14495.1 hyp